MNFFRLAIVLVALLISTQANADVHRFAFSATLESDVIWGNLIRVYPGGTAIEGEFQLDEGRPGIDYPDMRYTYGAFSGSVHVGGNTIHFADSLAYTYSPDYADITTETMLGGNAWNTGGSISETSAPGGYAVDGFQLRFNFLGAHLIDKPFHTLIAENTLLSNDLYLGYGIADNVFHGNWGKITELHEQPTVSTVPEPNMAFLIGLGFISLLAARKLKR